MGTILIGVVGVLTVAAGLALAWLPLGVIFLGVAIFALAWVLDRESVQLVDDLGDVVVTEGD